MSYCSSRALIRQNSSGVPLPSACASDCSFCQISPHTDPSLPPKEQKWKPLAIGIGYELEKAVDEWVGSGAVEVPQT